jgi:hypothetical protein
MSGVDEQVVRAVAKSLADLPPGARRRRDDSVSVGRWFLNVRPCAHVVSPCCVALCLAARDAKTGHIHRDVSDSFCMFGYHFAA